MDNNHSRGTEDPSAAPSSKEESIENGLDDRSSMAKAMDIVSRVTAMSISMVLPALGGYFLDQWLGTVVLFVILGTVFGLAAGFWQLFQLVRALNPDS